MRKLFTLIAAALTISSLHAADVKLALTADDLVNRGKWVNEETDCPAIFGGAFGKITKEENGAVAGDDMENAFAANNAVKKYGYTGYFQGGGINNISFSSLSKDLPDLTANDRASGVAFKPAVDGTIIVPIVLNENKSLWIVKEKSGDEKDHTSMVAIKDAVQWEYPDDAPAKDLAPEDNGISLKSSKKLTGLVISWPVEGGETYYIFCTGSKMGVYGYEFTEAKADEEPETPEEPAEPVEYQKYDYDFTTWSPETIANLTADKEGWSDDEKNDGSNVTDGNCVWMVGDASKGKVVAVGEDGHLYANGELIKELKGLDFANTKANRSLAIAINYPSAEISSKTHNYAGGAYLWLGGKNMEYFTLHNVQPGSTITMDVESHNNTDPRGVVLSVNGKNLTDPDGSTVEHPTAKETKVWQVPGEETDAPVDVVITNSNGCHLYNLTTTMAKLADDEEEGDTSALEIITSNEETETVIYDLLGRRVQNPSNGIYIINGKKVLVK